MFSFVAQVQLLTGKHHVFATAVAFGNATVMVATAGTTMIIDNDTEPRFTFTQSLFIGFMSCVLAFVTVTGNIMVMVSFKIDKQLQNISNYFLFSLALADFLIGLISMPLFTVYTILGYWPFGKHVCDGWLALDYLASNASVLNLLLISFDRYLSVTRPLTYRAKRTKNKALLFISAAWIISLGLWPPWIYLWPIIEGRRTVPERQCYIQFILTNQYITFGTAIAAFYVPVTVMCFLYFRIYRETKKRQKDLPNLQAVNKPQNDQQQDESWGRIRSESNQVNSLERQELYETSSLRKAYSQCSLKARRLLTWSWLRDWCVDWWHSGRDDDYDEEDDQTPSDVPGGTSDGTSVSRWTSLNVIHQQPTTPTPMKTYHGVHNNNNRLANRSLSNDSVYTIVIKLPSDIEQDVPTVRQYHGCYEDSRLVHGPSSSTGTLSRRPSSQDMRLPLNAAKIVQSNKPLTRAQGAALQAKEKKKKKFQEKKSERKAAKTLSAILLTFIITWTPYNILVLLKPFTADTGNGTDFGGTDNKEWVTQGMWDFFYYLCYINSTINPVCYALCNATFRMTYVRILKCKWNTRRQPPHFRA
ncbi:Muscarinic acetylcholine receptor family,G protein-coupled receptor, rhodopsin-like,GPCR, rhodopsin- [Cinara cedri]|uniref:Muscarinic acetylcholine receptor family,G protein-coupled receptor, rhodopsin-like,GPCR, rhodopsin n=1 Tax=Cinara cedri TaxID=506608 RepID=A0A5E4MTE0_9HEMI|nr:Muscarinic acetylcholine receptor family,G protein-coupled receptor, rhodopsin-like,GPCR, rhodopsin- [Cinara cedri]